MGDNIFKDDITRREAMKTALKGAAYAAPVVLAATVPGMVSAATPAPGATQTTTGQTTTGQTTTGQTTTGQTTTGQTTTGQTTTGQTTTGQTTAPLSAARTNSSLELTKTLVTAPTAANGFLATFAIAVQNNSGASLANVVISDSMVEDPGPGITAANFTSLGAGVTLGPDAGTVTIASLGMGTTPVARVNVTIDPTFQIVSDNVASLESVNGTAITPEVTARAAIPLPRSR